MKIKAPNDFWKWANDNFISILRVNKWYNNQRASNLIGFINDLNSRVVGIPIIRQIRVKNGKNYF